MGCYFYGNDCDKITVDDGPNVQNDVKLLLARLRKERQNTHTVSLEVHKRRDGLQYVIVCVPTPAYRAILDAEHEAWRATHPEQEYDPHAWRRARAAKKGKRRGRPKSEADEFDLLEERLCLPRSRHRGGFGRIYRPTRKRRYTRDDKKNWKRHRKVQWHIPAISFRFPEEHSGDC